MGKGNKNNFFFQSGGKVIALGEFSNNDVLVYLITTTYLIPKMSK